MFSEKFLLAVVVLAVMGITVGYFVAVEPEASRAISADNVVTVTGLSRESQPIQIEVEDQVSLPYAGFGYHVAPDAITLDEPVAVTFALSEEQSSRTTLMIYKRHPDLMMWEPVSPVTAHTSEILVVETAQLGTFAVADIPQFTPPVFANVYDELREQAPPEAVGYEIAVGFQTADQELVRLLDAGEQGGCAGTVRVGDGEALSRLERQVNVDIDDEQRVLLFVFVTRWFTSSTGGCDPEAPLRHLTEYDILDEIQT